MADKVKPLGFENPASGGTETFPLPTELDPLEDYVSAKGVAFENNDNRLIDLDASGNMQFLDAGQGTPFRLNKLVKDFGTTAHSLLASVQATVAGTKILTLSDNTMQIFTGNTAGQIVQLPNATTLQLGHMIEVWNMSLQQVQIRDAGSNLLATINANGRTQILLYDNSTANGSWSLTYSLDNGNVFGTNLYYQEALAETSTNSQVTWLNKITLVTPSLPFGTYLVQFQFQWRGGANRNMSVRIQRAAADIETWNPWVNNVNERQLLSGFIRQPSLSGVQTFTLDFRVGPTNGTTVYMSRARLFVWRIG